MVFEQFKVLKGCYVEIFVGNNKFYRIRYPGMTVDKVNKIP